MTSAIATLALALSLAPPDAVSLRWKLNKGDVFYVQTTTDLKQTIAVAGKEHKQQMKQTFVARYKVRDTKANQLILDYTILRAKSDSDILGADAFADRMKKASLTLTLDSQYQLTKVDGLDKFIDKVAGDNEAARTMLQSFMNQDFLRQNIAETFGFGPGKPVRPGDTWERKYKYPLGPIGNFAVDATYKLIGPTDGLQKVTMTATLKYSPPAAGNNKSPFKVSKGSLQADQFKATFLFDPKAGRLKESHVEMKSSGTMTIAVNETEIEAELKEQTVKATTTVSDTNPITD